MVYLTYTIPHIHMHKSICYYNWQIKKSTDVGKKKSVGYATITKTFGPIKFTRCEYKNSLVLRKNVVIGHYQSLLVLK